MAKLAQQQQLVVHQINKHGNKYNAAVTKVKRTRRSVPRDSPPQRSSIYRGVTRHRWTGRFEAHLWDKNCWNESQNKKGRQVYLGAYDDEEAAAHAYDLAALKYWGENAILNFPLSAYAKELKDMEGQSRDEYIGSLRRKSSGFSRGVSKYRGVARHHHNGRWEARIGRVFGNKYLYLGTYATQEEAATAYDMAAIEYRGLNAVTNFDLSRYIKWLRPNNNNQNGISDQPNSINLVDSYSNNSSSPPPPTNPGLDLGFINNFRQNQTQSSVSKTTTEPIDVHTASSRPTNATSALGLLLQSSKFKEMMEMTTSTATDDDDMTQTETRYDPPKCSFPENIQTYFECHRDSSEEEANYGDLNGDDFLFGDLNSFAPPIFNCGIEDDEIRHFNA